MSRVTVTEVKPTVTITETGVRVASVGVQGPRGDMVIGGKQTPFIAPSDNDLLIFNANQDKWVYTQEVDAGTFG